MIRGFGFLLLLIGAAVSWRGLHLGYINYRMPASGFFPFWDGLLLALAGIFLMISKIPPIPLPKDIVLRKQLTTIAVVACYVVIISILGTILATIIYFIAALYFVERHSRIVVALTAGISLFIIYASFEMWLNIPLARGIFDSY